MTKQLALHNILLTPLLCDLYRVV